MNPNIGYLVLMFSGMLTFLAILSPGSGVLEAAALAGLILTGIMANNLEVNFWAIVLLLTSTLPFYLVVWKRWQRAFLALSIVLFLLGAAYFFQGNGWVPAAELTLVGTISVLGGLALWIVSTKIIDTLQTRPLQDLDSLLGKVGDARTEIHHEGSVYVAGEMWSAHSRHPIPKGRQVRVIKRDGFIVEVEEVK